MPVYSYRAMDTREAVKTGTVAADTARQARDQLRTRGFIVHSIEEHKPSAGFLKSLRRRPVRTATLASTIRELATLLSVGISLLDALDTLIRQYRGSLRTSLMTLRDRVHGGASLSVAAGDQPELFDELTVRMIQVGEASGNLDAVLHRLADFKERSLELKDRVTGALLYPAIVLCISLLLTLFLITVVLPKLLDHLVESGRPLPWPTRVVKGLSETLTQQGGWIVLGGILLAAAVAAALKTHTGKWWFATILLKLPVIGSMAMKQSMARIAYVMATLLSTGVEFVKAAEIASRATRNVLFSQALMTSSERIRSGQEIGAALEQTGMIPPIVIQVFSVGQATGQMEVMLERLAETFDRQVASLSSRVTTIVEPVLILFLAVVIGFVLFATMLPILEAGNVL